MLISGCPVLKSLTLISMCYYCVETYRVCSQSLLSFTYEKFIGFVKDIAVVIDAPRLEHLRLSYHQPESVIIKNPGTLVEADINTVFNSCFEKKLDATDLQKRDMIRNFLVGISCVKDMIISSSTLQVIHDYSRCEPLPLFRNLSFLRVEFSDYRWEMLPIFLESCPDLKSLTLGFNKPPRDEGVSCIVPGPRRFLTSLESVKIAKPMAAEAQRQN